MRALAFSRVGCKIIWHVDVARADPPADSLDRLTGRTAPRRGGGKTRRRSDRPRAGLQIAAAPSRNRLGGRRDGPGAEVDGFRLVYASFED